jgi:hypothetical protein
VRPRYRVRMRSTAALLVLLAACAGPSTSTEPSTGPEPTAEPEAEAPRAPHPLPERITAEVQMPGPDESRYANATVTLSGLPWTITGCIGPRAACEETARIELDEAERGELVRAIEEVRAIPLCEPEGIFPGDRTYRLEITGAPRVYEGRLPADEGQLAQRNDGPCRADARLAWWVAARLR